jgi:hypothetical protein
VHLPILESAAAVSGVVDDIAALAQHYGPSVFRAAWSEGRAMSMQQVVQYALAETHDHVADDGARRGLAE